MDTYSQPANQEAVEETVVIFRRFRSDDKAVIALFPYLIHAGYTCQSYMHVGQHGAADYDGMIQATVPARAEEEDVIDLTAELKHRGYNLKVAQRQNRNKFLEVYRKALRG